MDNETFRPKKPEPQAQQEEAIDYAKLGMVNPKVAHAYHQQQKQDQFDIPADVETSTNPIIAKALFKNRQKVDRNEPSFTPQPNPQTATGNTNLDAMIAGIQVYQYQEIMLPSLGKFYLNEEAPSNGVIHVRPMAGTEEQILGTPRLLKKGQAVNLIFRSCVREPIVPEKLLTSDRTMLLIFLRGISQGPDYEVEIRCPACGEKFPYIIDLDKEVTACPQNFGPDNLTGILPQTGYRFNYRFATGKDDNDISEYREQRIRKHGDQAMDDTFSFRASLLVLSIEDPRTNVRIDDRQSIKFLLNRLPVGDLSHLRNIINEPPFGLDTKCLVICPACAEEFDIEMPMETSFFFPKKKKANIQV